MPRYRSPALALTFGLLACREQVSQQLATPSVDTLASGVIRVQNHGPSAWADTSAWSFVEDLRIGGGDSTATLEQPSGIAVDAAGRIYVSDGTIKLFDQAGRLVRTVGRNGEGPGEYRSAFLAVTGDHLIVQDVNLARASVFDSGGQFITSWRTLCCAPAPPLVDAQGNVVVWSPSSENSYQYVRYRPDGQLLDTLAPPPFPKTRLWDLHTGFGHWSTVIPFTPRGEATVLPATGLVYGWSEQYALVATRTGRDTAFVFSLEAAPVLVSDGRRAAATSRITTFLERNGRNIGGVAPEEIARVIHASDIPANGPAFVGLAADRGGRIWVERFAGDDTLRSHFDLFSPTGTYLGPVVAPVRLAEYGSTVWGDSAVYTITEDTAGLPAIVRYRLRRNP